jgi:hypothetical protein
MKILNWVLLMLLCFSIGCTTFGIKSPKTDARDDLDDKWEQIEIQKEKTAVNSDKRLNQIGILSRGVDYAMDNVGDNDLKINVAKQLNDRVMSLANNPDIKNVVRIQEIVKELISSVEKERVDGNKKLNDLDKELQLTQTERLKIKSLLEKREKEFNDLSYEVAKKSDKNEAVVDEMNKWFGLGAVYYGFKKFIGSFILVMVIVMVLFLVLKMLAATNPIAASIFGIFDVIGGIFLKLIRFITPKSINFAKVIPTETYNFYKNPLDKIVDTYERLKQENKLLSDDKKHTLEDMSIELSKIMDESDKKAIEECLAELKWK